MLCSEARISKLYIFLTIQNFRNKAKNLTPGLSGAAFAFPLVTILLPTIPHQPRYKVPPLSFPKSRPNRREIKCQYLFRFFCLNLEHRFLHLFVIYTLHVEANSLLNGQNICNTMQYTIYKFKTQYKKSKTEEKRSFNK